MANGIGVDVGVGNRERNSPTVIYTNDIVTTVRSMGRADSGRRDRSHERDRGDSGNGGGGSVRKVHFYTDENIRPEVGRRLDQPGSRSG